MHETLEPSGAVAEMLAKDGTLDDILSGRGLRFDPAPVAPAPEPAGPTFVIPRPDWDAEQRERLERERLEREAQTAAEREAILASLPPSAKSLEPVPAPRRRRLIPNLGQRP